MPVRLRKFVGAIMLIALVVTWALLAMALAQSAVVKTNGLIEVIYYIVAGLGWVLPAMPLIRWMSRPDRSWCAISPPLSSRDMKRQPWR
jgi:hypothetical protein